LAVQAAEVKQRLATSRADEATATRQRDEFKTLYNDVLKEMKTVKKTLEKTNATKLEKAIELERCKTERKKIEAAQALARDLKKFAEIKAAEESKLKVLTEHAKIRQREIEDKQKAKQAAEKKKVVDDTKKV
jgi:hypothetical protein